jgi:hypothetical protein
MGQFLLLQQQLLLLKLGLASLNSTTADRWLLLLTLGCARFPVLGALLGIR